MNKKFVIFGHIPGTSESLAVVGDKHGQVRLFNTYQKAWDWASNQLTPDWEFSIFPIEVAKVWDIDDAENDAMIAHVFTSLMIKKNEKNIKRITQ